MAEDLADVDASGLWPGQAVQGGYGIGTVGPFCHRIRQVVFGLRDP